MQNHSSLLSLAAAALLFVAPACSPAGGGGGAGGTSAAGAGGGGRGGSGGGAGGASASGGSGAGGSGTAGSAGSGSGGSGSGGTGGGSPATGGSGGADGTGGSAGGSGGTADGGGETGGGTGGTGGNMPPPAGMGEPPLPACKRTVEVANAGALGGALTGAMPGDCLVLADGDYPAPMITAKGTEAAPIVVRAANRLKANFNGVVRLMDAEYVILEGFTFPGASGTSIAGASHHCRVTRSRYFTGTANVNGTAKDNRIDRCEFGPKGSDGNLVQPTGLSENTRIDRNYFHDVSGGGGNGRETIRLGCCGAMFDLHETGNIVEHNLLVNCSGEAEIISVKSSKNTIRYNTIRNSAGNLTLRAGKNNLVYGNFVFGTGNQGGFRIFDTGHKIWNNYIQTGSALIGNRSGPIHAAVGMAVIVHNTFIGSVTLTGSGNTFSDNITGGSVSVSGAMSQGNLTAAAAGLTRIGEMMAVPAMSKAIDAATGSYPFLMDDVQGQPRKDKADVGADEFTVDPALYRPLTPADVGPNAP
jgi:poly(beta-D-mannuronate) lyase